MNWKQLKLQIGAELVKLWRARFGRIAFLAIFLSVTFPVILIGLLGDRNVTTFPGIVNQLLLPSLTLLIGIVSVLLALSSWGDEYEHKTLRTVLGRSPDRRQFVLGKIIALGIALLLIIVLALLVESLVAGLSHIVQVGGDDLGMHLSRLLRVALPMTAVWWLGGMVYIGLAVLATVAGRSPALGMAAALGFFLADFLLSNLGPSGSSADFAQYFVTHNSYGLFAAILRDRFAGASGGMFADLASLGLPDWDTALTYLLVLAAGCLAATFVFFREQDLVQG